MRWLARIFAVVLFIVLVLTTVSFLTANPEAYQLSFLHWNAPESSVGSLLVISFVLGALVGLAAGAPIILGLRRQTKRMQRRIAQQKEAAESAPAP